jgi:hypothetical protein
MSLSTQLTRGTLALPMLALFGALALVAAGRSVEAQAKLPLEIGAPAAEAAEAAERELAIATGRELVLEVRSDAAACGARARPQMLLANAPGDLGPIAQRQGNACRA